LRVLERLSDTGEFFQKLRKDIAFMEKNAKRGLKHDLKELSQDVVTWIQAQHMK
jgi:hypothetical protein